MHVCVFDCRTLMFSSGIAVTPSKTLMPCPTALFQTTAMFLLETESVSQCNSNTIKRYMSNQVAKNYLRDLRNHNESYYLSKSFHSGLSEQSF